MRLTHGAYILARFSTDNQEVDSIDVQVQKCREWCAREHLSVLDVFADEATSGMKNTRPEYSRMMRQLADGGADTVVIYDQSRMFRKLTAWFQFREQMSCYGVRVVAVTQPIIGGDLRDPMTFLSEGSMALMNQMWVLQTRQKVIEKMRYMAEQGKHTGGKPPLGYA
jgi:site-specific DNA recombinase